MMNTEFIKKQIEAMNVKSDDFWDIYTMVCDKYYSFPDPDDFLQATMDIRMYIDKATHNYEEQTIALHKILVQLFKMEKNNTKTCAGEVAFKDKSYFFTIATDHKHLKDMQDMMAKVLNGDINIEKK